MKALEFPSDFMEIKDAPPIILNVFDEDPGYFDADDYLGRAEIFLKDAQYSTDDTIKEPSWHPIKFGIGDDAPSCG